MKLAPLAPYQALPPWARLVDIPDGDAGTIATLDIAAPLARGALLDPMFPIWARSRVLVPGIDPRESDQVLGHVFDFVVTNIGFQADPLGFEADPRARALGLSGNVISDYVQSPHWTAFVEQKGDCLAHAGLVSAICMSLGYPARFRVVRGDPQRPESFSHVYAVCGPKLRALDTSLGHGRFGVEPGAGVLPAADYPVSESA